MRRAHWLPALWSLPLAAGLAAAPQSAPPAQPNKAALQAKAHALVKQMEQGNEAARVQAEWQLLKLGPEALPFLPGGNKELLAPARFTLEEMRPRTWTPQSTDMVLAEA